MGASAVRTIRVRQWGLTVLGAATLGLAVTAAVGLAAPSASNPLPLAYAIEERAIAVAATDPLDAPRFEALNRQVLAQAPMSAEAWLRLAWLADHRGDDASRNAYLERTYTIAPYGPFVSRNRLRLAYDNWRTLTVPLRQQAIEETRLLIRTRSEPERGLGEEITDPSGRFALRLTLNQARLEQRAEAAATPG